MINYDPYMDEILENPYPTYERLRDEAPVLYLEEYNAHFLSRFNVVWDAASDSKHFITQHGTTPGHLLTHDTPPTSSFNAFDPPEHTARRTQVKQHFIPNSLGPIREQVSAVADECLAEMREAGGGDLVGTLAARVSVTGACLAGGIPLEIREQGIEWVNGVMHRRKGHKGGTEVGAKAGKDMFFYLLDHVKEMRKNPERATGVLKTLLTVPVSGELLDDFAVTSTLSLVLIGGSDTFPKTIGATLYRLWKNPDQRNQVVEDPKLIRKAFLEALRIDTPTQMLGRTCVEATEVHGQRIEPGQGVLFLWAAANRDEREFEDPNRYDMHRRAPRMLAFGQGAHMCLGHHVAKMEADVVLRKILEIAPNYEIVEAEAERNRTEFVQGWTELPTKFA